MSQYDFGTIDPYVVDGVQLAGMLNQDRDAMHTLHRGATRPAYAVPGMWWINDSAGAANWVVMVYLSPTVGDKPLFTYNTTTGAIGIAAGSTGSVTAANLIATADSNPSVQWNATGNPIDMKWWRATETPTGSLRFASYTDGGAEVAAIQFERDGSAPLLVPAGTVWDYAGTSATVPPAWYLCDGSLKSRTVDGRLFTVIGTNYGAGDGSTTFALPDLRGRVVAGIDNMGGTNASRLNATVSNATLPGGVGGEQTHTLSVAELAQHTHSSDLNASGMQLVTNVSGNALWTNLAFGGGTGVNVFQSGSVAYTGSNGGHNNTQPTMTMNKIIKR